MYPQHIRQPKFHPNLLGKAAIGAAALGTGAIANNLMGNPIGGAIDAATFGATNFRPDEPPYGQLANAHQQMYDQQVRDSMHMADVAAQQQQEMAREMFAQQQATQMLNSYLEMIQNASKQASTVVGNRY